MNSEQERSRRLRAWTAWLGGCVLPILVTGLCSRAVGEGSWESDRAESLRGLKGTAVTINIEPKEDAEKNGLWVGQVRTDVELRLRLAGIRVYTQEELPSSPGRPQLYARVFLVKQGWLRYSFVLDLLLYQDVSLERAPARKFQACTWWSMQYLGSCGSGEMAEHIRRVIREQVDSFINSYLSVNPK